MANDITGRPWVLDTAGLVKAGRTITSGFVFRDYTGGGGSKATITDAVRGTVVCTLVGAPNGVPVGEAWFIPQIIQNLTLALDSGHVTAIIK